MPLPLLALLLLLPLLPLSGGGGAAIGAGLWACFLCLLLVGARSVSRNPCPKCWWVRGAS